MLSIRNNRVKGERSFLYQGQDISKFRYWAYGTGDHRWQTHENERGGRL